VLDDDGLTSLESGSVDVLLVCSVLQYVPEDDVPRLIALWQRLLRPGGLLILADITTPRSGPILDALSLLYSGARYGYFFSALASLVAIVFSDYRKTRQSLRLSTYAPDKMLTMLTPGFEARRSPSNFGLNAFRTTILARKKTDGGEHGQT